MRMNVQLVRLLNSVEHHVQFLMLGYTKPYFIWLKEINNSKILSYSMMDSLVK